MNNEDDLNGFKAWLKSLPNKERSVLKIGFTGTVNLTLAAKLDDLIDANAEIFASLKRHKRTTDLTIAPDEFDQDSVSLSGYARTAWEDLLSNADTDHEAQDALRLFYRLSEQ